MEFSLIPAVIWYLFGVLNTWTRLPSTLFEGGSTTGDDVHYYARINKPASALFAFAAAEADHRRTQSSADGGGGSTGVVDWLEIRHRLVKADEGDDDLFALAKVDPDFFSLARVLTLG